MALKPPARRFVLLAAATILVSACGSQSDDPKALPSWIAVYPGSHPQPVGSAFVFYTQDPAEKVLDFYERQLAPNGVHKEARGGGEYGGFLSAADESHSRNVMIEVGPPDKGAAAVSITVVKKK